MSYYVTIDSSCLNHEYSRGVYVVEIRTQTYLSSSIESARERPDLIARAFAFYARQRLLGFILVARVEGLSDRGASKTVSNDAHLQQVGMTTRSTFRAVRRQHKVVLRLLETRVRVPRAPRADLGATILARH